MTPVPDARPAPSATSPDDAVPGARASGSVTPVPVPAQRQVRQRSWPRRLAWLLRDYGQRVWDNAGENNVFFLAGGIAFNILLAAVPFVLLLVSVVGYVLNRTADASAVEVATFVGQLLPPGQLPLRAVIVDAVSARGQIGLLSGITFVWFSTRLFGSLRSVLADVFDIESDRGIVAGKIFDAQMTIFATVFVALYTLITAYITLGTTRGIGVLSRLGLRADIMGQLEYNVGRLIAFLVVVTMFFALYKVLPNRRIRWQTALVAALFTSLLFELARNVFAVFVTSFNPGTLYTGTLYAIVLIVFWVYYAALIFVLGGEVAQVYELRRVRAMQREVFDR